MAVALDSLVRQLDEAVPHARLRQVLPRRQPLQISSFESTPCGNPSEVAEVLLRLRSGVVRGPRNQANLKGPTFTIAVVVTGSAQQPAQLNSFVYNSGRPGAALTIYAGCRARHPYAAGRALILVDYVTQAARSPVSARPPGHARRCHAGRDGRNNPRHPGRRSCRSCSLLRQNPGQLRRLRRLRHDEHNRGLQVGMTR